MWERERECNQEKCLNHHGECLGTMKAKRRNINSTQVLRRVWNKNARNGARQQPHAKGVFLHVAAAYRRRRASRKCVRLLLPHVLLRSDQILDARAVVLHLQLFRLLVEAEGRHLELLELRLQLLVLEHHLVELLLRLLRDVARLPQLLLHRLLHQLLLVQLVHVVLLLLLDLLVQELRHLHPVLLHHLLVVLLRLVHPRPRLLHLVPQLLRPCLLVLPHLLHALEAGPLGVHLRPLVAQRHLRQLVLLLQVVEAHLGLLRVRQLPAHVLHLPVELLVLVPLLLQLALRAALLRFRVGLALLEKPLEGRRRLERLAVLARDALVHVRELLVLLLQRRQLLAQLLLGLGALPQLLVDALHQLVLRLLRLLPQLLDLLLLLADRLAHRLVHPVLRHLAAVVARSLVVPVDERVQLLLLQVPQPLQAALQAHLDVQLLEHVLVDARVVQVLQLALVQRLVLMLEAAVVVVVAGAAAARLPHQRLPHRLLQLDLHLVDLVQEAVLLALNLLDLDLPAPPRLLHLLLVLRGRLAHTLLDLALKERLALLHALQLAQLLLQLLVLRGDGRLALVALLLLRRQLRLELVQVAGDLVLQALHLLVLRLQLRLHAADVLRLLRPLRALLGQLLLEVRALPVEGLLQLLVLRLPLDLLDVDLPLHLLLRHALRALRPVLVRLHHAPDRVAVPQLAVLTLACLQALQGGLQHVVGQDALQEVHHHTLRLVQLVAQPRHQVLLHALLVDRLLQVHLHLLHALLQLLVARRAVVELGLHVQLVALPRLLVLVPLHLDALELLTHALLRLKVAAAAPRQTLLQLLDLRLQLLDVQVLRIEVLHGLVLDLLCAVGEAQRRDSLCDVHVCGADVREHHRLAVAAEGVLQKHRQRGGAVRHVAAPLHQRVDHRAERAERQVDAAPLLLRVAGRVCLAEPLRAGEVAEVELRLHEHRRSCVLLVVRRHDRQREDGVRTAAVLVETGARRGALLRALVEVVHALLGAGHLGVLRAHDVEVLDLEVLRLLRLRQQVACLAVVQLQVLHLHTVRTLRVVCLQLLDAREDRVERVWHHAGVGRSGDASHREGLPRSRLPVRKHCRVVTVQHRLDERHHLSLEDLLLLERVVVHGVEGPLVRILHLVGHRHAAHRKVERHSLFAILLLRVGHRALAHHDPDVLALARCSFLPHLGRPPQAS
eukprot:Rhum_TRINITY_DN14497_c11_g1::Rhum_TRINITY_DN14497_c11_g1_i1::g.93140::m.93140